MSDLYNRASVIMPDKTEIPIQKLIDIITLKELTPNKLQWVDLMVKAQLENDYVPDCLNIKPGMADYVYRQIIYYAIDAMMGDQLT